MNIKQEDAIYVQISPDNPAVTQNGDLCEDCGHCGAICQEEMNVLGHTRTGKGQENLCIHCGQCSAACPEKAIQVKSEVEMVKQAIHDSSKIVVFSTSPSVRVGIGDEFLEKTGTYSEGKMVTALRTLGANFVMDVTFSADLTIMEEGMELIYRLAKRQKPLPQFTSCCPGWVNYVELFHPELLDNLSTAKSPICMQGAILKTYFAQKKGIRPENIVNVTVTPCTAKKFEIRRPEFQDAAIYNRAPGMRDNDYSITTKELVSWMQEENINFASLMESQFDNLMGKGSGAGVIFGSTGGVMEAALRMAYESLTAEEAPDLLFDLQPVRGLCGIKEAELVVAGLPVKVAVVYGTANAEKLIQSGRLDEYTFIEVMSCPGGCISGSGQPQHNEIPPTNTIRKNRMNSLYHEDKKMSLRKSTDNPDIHNIYREFLKQPCSQLSEKMLHTTYYKR